MFAMSAKKTDSVGGYLQEQPRLYFTHLDSKLTIPVSRICKKVDLGPIRGHLGYSKKQQGMRPEPDQKHTLLGADVPGLRRYTPIKGKQIVIVCCFLMFPGLALEVCASIRCLISLAERTIWIHIRLVLAPCVHLEAGCQ